MRLFKIMCFIAIYMRLLTSLYGSAQYSITVQRQSIWVAWADVQKFSVNILIWMNSKRSPNRHQEWRNIHGMSASATCIFIPIIIIIWLHIMNCNW